jgi:hypothetical protein
MEARRSAVNAFSATRSSGHTRAARSRSALAITETELKAIVSLPRWRGRVRKVGHAALAICS